MTPLIDTDILLYEVASICQYKDEETGEVVPASFDKVIEVWEEKVLLILELSWADAPPMFFLTGANNFRKEIAVTKPYKGNRPPDKPFHYHNLKAYVESHYDTYCDDNLEADDLMAIEQAKRDDTIICSRDKDLRMCKGWHFGWESGKQPQYGPREVGEIGELALNDKNKIVGNGLMFFYSQLITGDATDNIQGIKGQGDVAAYNCLKDCTSPREMYEAVRDLYQEKVGEDWLPLLKENAYLLWMVRELKDGKPVMWSPPLGEI